MLHLIAASPKLAAEPVVRNAAKCNVLSSLIPNHIGQVLIKTD